MAQFMLYLMCVCLTTAGINDDIQVESLTFASNYSSLLMASSMRQAQKTVLSAYGRPARKHTDFGNTRVTKYHDVDIGTISIRSEN